jgi:hypothetical protein
MKLSRYTHPNDKYGLSLSDKIYTADDHKQLTERVYGKGLESREALMRTLLQRDSAKLTLLEFLIDDLRKQAGRYVLSLGSGACLWEYLLKMSLPDDSRVIATDFNPLLVERAKMFFPTIEVEPLTFDSEALSILLRKIKVPLDLAFFMCSAYAMDDELFISILKVLKRNGVKRIIDIHAGYISFSRLPRILYRHIRAELRFKLSGMNKGKHDGYGRTRNSLRKLYRKAGLEILDEKAFAENVYIAVCRANP